MIKEPDLPNAVIERMPCSSIALKNLTFTYGDTPLLKNINFHLQEGECLYIQGKNGAGKSTLLKLIVGLIKPHAGQIYWQHQDIESCLPRYLNQLVYVGHQNGLSEALTLKENLHLDWHYGRSKRQLCEGVDRLQLTSYLDYPVAHLSKGQQRKAALLRLWMSDAPLWVLDEPLSALDKDAFEVIVSWMMNHLAQNNTIVMTSHQVVSQLEHYPRLFLS